MYNLLVSANSEAWSGQAIELEKSRCVREYTDDDVIEKYGTFTPDAFDQLCQLPSIFAYESGGGDPKFGRITKVKTRANQVKLYFKIFEVEPFLTARDLADLKFELDINKWELNRTHWAVKDIDLISELNHVGISLPTWAHRTGRAVNLLEHRFKVALSFPGESRELVEQVAEHLEHLLGPDSYFYDENYAAQLARPSLDLLLQEIYSARSELLVAFIGQDYQRKDWCGIEFRAIRQIIGERHHDRVMYVKLDDGAVDGVLPQDGYVDARRHSAEAIAGFIAERSEHLSRAKPA